MRKLAIRILLCLSIVFGMSANSMNRVEAHSSSIYHCHGLYGDCHDYVYSDGAIIALALLLGVVLVAAVVVVAVNESNKTESADPALFQPETWTPDKTFVKTEENKLRIGIQW